MLALLDAQHLPLPANVLKKGRGADAVVYLGRAESGGPYNPRTNNPWLTRAVFGPQEMNFNWYSSWAGQDRVVVMSVQHARASHVPLEM